MNSKEAKIGNVPASWYVEELRFFLDLITYGFTNPMPDSKEGPWKLTAKDIIDGRINYAAARKTTLDAFTNNLTNKSRPKVGDVLLTKDGSIGRVAVVDREGICINQSVALLRPNKQIDPHFLKYLLSAPYYQQVMEGDSDGSTIKHIYITRVDKMQVAVPSLEEQRAILKIVGTIDDRIALLSESNATLEAIAQALFKSWFVDFDPVRAKAEGREPEGLDAETAGLFPDCFEDDASGLIPTGWTAGTLASLSDLNPESWSAKNHPETVAYIDLANAKDNEIAAITEYAFDEAPSRARRVLRSGDTIVGTVRPGNRSFAFIGTATQNLTGSTGFAVLRPSASQNAEFVYLAATADTSIEYLTRVADGGAYPAVRPDVVASLGCINPSSPVMQAFHAIAAPIFDKVSANQKQMETLSSLRGTLLPRLISGALRLPEAEALLQDVA